MRWAFLLGGMLLLAAPADAASVLSLWGGGTITATEGGSRSEAPAAASGNGRGRAKKEAPAKVPLSSSLISPGTKRGLPRRGGVAEVDTSRHGQGTCLGACRPLTSDTFRAYAEITYRLTTSET